MSGDANQNRNDKKLIEKLFYRTSSKALRESVSNEIQYVGHSVVFLRIQLNSDQKQGLNDDQPN